MDQIAADASVEGERAVLSVFWADLLNRLAKLSFALWLLLSLTTPAVRRGPFTWWPLLTIGEFGGRRIVVGALMLLPALAAIGWVLSRLVGRASHRWRWGRSEVVIPLLGLTVLALLSLDPALSPHTVLHGGSLAIVWFVLLFLTNTRWRPLLVVALSAVILVQGSVAMAQFLLQSDLGLVAWGELSLDPMVSGVVVLQAQGRPWLRAYGLTAHPNVLGAMLAALWFLLLPAYDRTSGWRRLALAVVLAVGFLGLLASFSRAAWLAFIAALLLWFSLRHRDEHQNRALATVCSRHAVLFLLLVLPGLLLLFLYRDLVLSRFLSLDTTIEARSITDRLRDMRLALRLIAAHPVRGVGLGNFHSAATALNQNALIVHNVPLLVAAELGIPGLLLWGWMALVPFARRGGQAAARLSPWLLLIVVGMFDLTLWWGDNWQTAILFALLAARVCGRTGGESEGGDHPPEPSAQQLSHLRWRR